MKRVHSAIRSIFPIKASLNTGDNILCRLQQCQLSCIHLHRLLNVTEALLGNHGLLPVLLQQVVGAPSLDDLVVNVGDVHDVQDVVPKVVGQDPAENVKGDVGPVVHVWRREGTFEGIPYFWDPVRH